jgi:sugar-specific transcriptional regulator TrmB
MVIRRVGIPFLFIFLLSENGKHLKAFCHFIFLLVVKRVKSSELQKALETMNLTEYEAKAYLNLIQTGTSNAGKLSKIAEIPHSKIYEVLARLEKKKLIDVQKGRPLFFKAIKPSLALKGMETELNDNLKHELDQIKSDLEIRYEKKLRQISQAHNMLSELDNFYEKNTAIEPSEEFIWTIRGKDNLNSQAKEIIQSASSEVRLMMPLDDFSELILAIKTVSARDVDIMLVIHEFTGSVQKLKGSAEIFYDKSPLPTNCGMVLADDKRGMFISENSETGFKTSSKSVLMVLSQFYQHELKESEEI